MQGAGREDADMLGLAVDELLDFADEVGPAAVEDGLAALGRGGEVGGEESAVELATLREPTGGKIEPDCDGREAHAHLLPAKCDRHAVRGVVDSGGAGAEGGNCSGRHCFCRAVKKAKRPPGVRPASVCLGLCCCG